MSTLFEVKDLTIKTGDKHRLLNVNLTVAKGEYLCVIGPNGAGKSTLLKATMRLTPIESGLILVQGQSISKLSQTALAKRISYVPQLTDHPIPFIVSDFIKLARYPYQSFFSDWSSRDLTAYENAIAITEVSPFLDRQMNTLSGGEKQRVMIAAAICQEAELLLLDEPTSFLDPHHQVAMHQLICRLNQQHGITVIEVSHDLNHACHHSHRILALKDGKMHWQGPSLSFLTSSELQRLYDQAFVLTSHPETNLPVALASEKS